jgi:predicted PurR-regulated permease PerM
MGDENESSGVGSEVAGTGLAAILGTLLGGPVGGVVGAAAAPPMTQLVRKAWAELVGSPFAAGHRPNQPPT